MSELWATTNKGGTSHLEGTGLKGHMARTTEWLTSNDGFMMEDITGSSDMRLAASSHPETQSREAAGRYRCKEGWTGMQITGPSTPSCYFDEVSSSMTYRMLLVRRHYPQTSRCQ